MHRNCACQLLTLHEDVFEVSCVDSAINSNKNSVSLRPCIDFAPLSGMTQNSL